MHLDGVGYTIVGVMPQGLDFPRGTEFWVPVFAARSEQVVSATELDVVGRLAPGATSAAARDELTAFFHRAGSPPWQRQLRGVATTLPELVVGDTRPALFAFAAASALLLLITCINVANLLLVRGLARVREVAVRSALGAGRARIVAQLLAENAVLAIAGGVLGVAVATGAVRLFVAFAPPGVPRLDEVAVNAAAVAGAAGITGVAMLLFALAPALVTSRVELQQVLRSGARESQGRRARRVTEALVAGQVALALVVLSAAGVIARSLLRLESVNLSFASSRLLVGELALRASMFDDKAKQVALLDRIGERLTAVPGVRAWSPVVAVPFSGVGGWDGSLAAEGQTREEAAANPMLNIELVGPGYFAALGMPVIEGRAFTTADRELAPSVIVVSRSTARYYWPGQDPIGKRLRLGSSLEQASTVVGVVPDTRYRDLRSARPSVYYALRQSFFPFAPTDLVIRTNGPPSELVPAIRRAVEAASPGVVLANVAPFDVFLDAPLAQPRLNAVLLGMFALAAVALAAVGLFGVMATMVRQRARELGVRMALGATATDLRRMVLGRGLAIAVAGTAIGLLGAVLANRLLAGMLYEISPTDGVTLVLVSGLLLIVATLASLIPARAGTRIDPVLALRAEG
jgi:predicted permease